MERAVNLYDVFTEQDIDDMWEFYKRLVNVSDINLIKLHMMCEMIIKERGLFKLIPKYNEMTKEAISSSDEGH